jgi:SAM-dependent methyltransferase
MSSKAPPPGVDEFRGNADRFSGFADLYDRFRARPPDELATLLARFGGWPTLALVVDLGSGTGLSTRYWASKAERVIGVEPTADMRAQATAATADSNVSYRDGLSHMTGLPARCATLVSCSQSLHWMAPQPTFEEAARILVPGGVFAACDYDWPPATGAWAADAAFDECLTTVKTLERELKVADRLQQWDKSGHLGRMRASGCFRYTREALLHHVDLGDAERLVGLLLSQGSTMDLLKAGLSEAQLGVDKLREVAAHALGATPRLWFWSARIRMGVV